MQLWQNRSNWNPICQPYHLVSLYHSFTDWWTVTDAELMINIILHLIDIFGFPLIFYRNQLFFFFTSPNNKFYTMTAILFHTKKFSFKSTKFTYIRLLRNVPITTRSNSLHLSSSRLINSGYVTFKKKMSLSLDDSFF